MGRMVESWLSLVGCALDIEGESGWDHRNGVKCHGLMGRPLGIPAVDCSLNHRRCLSLTVHYRCMNEWVNASILFISLSLSVCDHDHQCELVAKHDRMVLRI